MNKLSLGVKIMVLAGVSLLTQCVSTSKKKSVPVSAAITASPSIETTAGAEKAAPAMEQKAAAVGDDFDAGYDRTRS